MRKLSAVLVAILANCASSQNPVAIPDISGTYVSDDCPKMVIDRSYIHIGSDKYAYAVKDIKGYKYIDMDGSLVYTADERGCSIHHEDDQRYLRLRPDGAFFDIEMFSAAENEAVYFGRLLH